MPKPFHRCLSPASLPAMLALLVASCDGPTPLTPLLAPTPLPTPAVRSSGVVATLTKARRLVMKSFEALAVLLVVAMSAVGCDGKSSPPGPTSPQSSGLTPESSTRTLSGSVFEVFPDGTKRAYQRPYIVDVEIDTGLKTDPRTLNNASPDSSGRYSLAVPLNKFVKIFSVTGVTVIVFVLFVPL